MIYTNLNVNNMANELKQHFIGVSNKKYIKDCILYHYKEKLITAKEKTELLKHYNIKN